MRHAVGAGGRARPRVGLGSLHIAAAASLAAGAIHAAAVGAHGDHRAAQVTFAVAAAIQLAWGAWAMVRSDKAIAIAGMLANGALVAGWMAAKTTGISFVAGLERPEPVQYADAAAAGFAALAAFAVLARLLDGRNPAEWRHPGAIPSTAAFAALVALGVPALVGIGGHAHAGGHDVEVTTAGGSLGEEAGSEPGATHSHDPGVPGGASGGAAAVPTGDAPSTAPSAAGATDDHVHTAIPVSYDPDLPIDLSGTPGVTPRQQAAAENLIGGTLLRLHQFDDPAVAEAQGWRSIGDGLTGFEHLINWELINDDDILDPDKPESLVYQVDRATGTRTLVSAMYMLPTSYTLDTVPEIGGPLMQWHIHDNLCMSGDPDQGEFAPRVVGLTDAQGTCRFGVKLAPSPMVHVWVIKHACGPFASLEGVGAGQVADGQSRLCDHAHGDSETPFG